MKIIQITTFFHPITGGVESHVYSLSKELVNLGHEVQVLTSDSAKNGPRIKRTEETLSGFKIIRFFTLFSLSFFHKFCPGMLFYLLKSDFDILHVHGFRKIETYFALLAAWIKKKKVILTTHNPFPTIRPSWFNKFIISLHDKTIGYWFTKKLSKIITIVKNEKEIFTTKFKVDENKIIMIPNGIDQIYLTNGNPENFYLENKIDRTKWDAIVLSICRLNYTKGLQNLQLAVKKLPKVLFFIAGGDDGYLKELKSLYFDSPNVMFNEVFLPQDKIIDIYSSANIFVLPSLHEAFGIALLEAMSQGCVVISTNVGGPKELIKENIGYLIDPTDQKAWYEKINYVINNPQEAKKIAENGKAFAQKFLWVKLAKKITAVYQQSLN